MTEGADGAPACFHLSGSQNAQPVAIRIERDKVGAELEIGQVLSNRQTALFANPR